MNFTEFTLNEKLLAGIEAAGYVNCTPVQEKVLGAFKNLENQKLPDLYVQSQTGTGKTAAYLISTINALLLPQNAGKKLLVLVPTRELAVQVEEEAKVLISKTGLKVCSVYGGVGYEKQISMLKKGVDIIIGTPGRIIDLEEGKNLDLSNANYCVIDEADRMFDMGFFPDLRKILKCLPEAEQRVTMLFSATLNSYVKNLAWEYTRDPIEITIEAENITVSEISQELLHVSSSDKMRLLIGVLKKENPESVIIFCNTKRSCEVVAKRLVLNDLKAEYLIGDLPQSKRLAILKKFKAGDLKIMVATDVAARGIDVDDLAMVVNYDLPVEAENYVHRIGRTARAGKTGQAYTFCSEQDVYNLPAIERYIEMSIPASVAYEDQMMEDKSSGVYIKTEEWHSEEKYESRGGYRNKSNNRKDSKPYSKGSYQKGDSYKRSDSKSENKGSYNKNKNGKKFSKASLYIDPSKLSGLSYEERMKVYKEAYMSKNERTDNRRPNSYSHKKSNNKNYNNYKNNNNKKQHYNSNKPIQQKKAPVKQSIFSKIKSLFSKKSK